MKKLMNILALFIPILAISCGNHIDDSSAGKNLDAPTSLSAQQLDLTTVKLIWTDNATAEESYKIYLRGETDSYYVPYSTADADATSCVFNDLAPGRVYHFGVQALSGDDGKDSEVAYLLNFKVLDREALADQEGVQRVASPTEVNAFQTDNTTVTVTWIDNAADENGYNVYMRESSAGSFGEPVASLPADTRTYEFKDLNTGSSYVFGVQASARSVINDSRIEVAEITLKDLAGVPEVTDIKTSYSYVAVNYKVRKIEGSNPEHGLCFSAEGIPTVEDIKVYGPEIKADTEILQVVSNVYLEQDKDYTMCVFIKNGSCYEYSESQTVKLEAQPAAADLSWEKQTYDKAEGVEIYKTSSQLNGRSFNAWYAVADPSKVDFRVMYPEEVGAKQSVPAQAEAADDCLVLMNGAIYGNYNIGVIITEGEMTQKWHGEIEGCYWATDNQLYQITRPVIGVDKNGKAAAYWVGVPQQGTFYYYDRPQTNVVGQAKYQKVTSKSPAPAVAWNPWYAISCGPMVLYDGKVCADNTMVDDKHYYTNYECWDESGVYSAHPDRSAVGVTADGKIVLFICDGRIDDSQGAYIKELGPIMKSIGCIHAMNLDGGGSTGMWVNGAGMINHKDGSSWRAVKSTLGFFKK